MQDTSRGFDRCRMLLDLLGVTRRTTTRRAPKWFCPGRLIRRLQTPGLEPVFLRNEASTVCAVLTGRRRRRSRGIARPDYPNGLGGQVGDRILRLPSFWPRGRGAPCRRGGRPEIRVASAAGVASEERYDSPRAPVFFATNWIESQPAEVCEHRTALPAIGDKPSKPRRR